VRAALTERVSMNNYRTTAPRIARWYLTEWEQHERLQYRQRLHTLAAAAGALIGTAGAVGIAKLLGL
jgi:hypothetical protein